MKNENHPDEMIGDKQLKITIEEKFSPYCEHELGLTPAKPLVFIADGVEVHVDKFKQDLLSDIHKLINDWHACEDISFTVK